MPDLLLTYYGDDFTGSTDSLEVLTRAGAHTALFFATPTAATLSRYSGLTALGVAGATRALPPDAMEAELRPALESLRQLGARHVHYKVCSTFDSSPTIGSIGRAIDVGSRVFASSFVPLLVGAPALGRYCVFGNLFARTGIGTDTPPQRLDRLPAMRHHPITPMSESDLRMHLAKQTSQSIGLFDILDVQRPPDEQRARLDTILQNGETVVLFDVLYQEQLPPLGALLDHNAAADKPLFSVGSSAVEMALGAHWKQVGELSPVQNWDDPGEVAQILVVAGSCSPVTAGQIDFSATAGFVEVELDTASLAADETNDGPLRQASELATRHVSAGRSVIVHTARSPSDPRIQSTAQAFAARGMNAAETAAHSARLFGTALGAVARDTVAQTGVRRICIAGGDTSWHVARVLGLEALEMIAPLAPGAPLCRARAPGTPADGLQVNIKGGQVGNEAYFLSVGRGHL